MASSRNPFFFCCFEQRSKPSLSPVFPAFTNLGQTGGTKGASNAIRCRFFRPPARYFPLPLNNPSFRPASSLCGAHLLFSLYSTCCCPKTSGECRDTPEPGNMFPSGSQNACLPAFALLHASLPGVPDLPTLRHILVRHLSSMQGKDVSEYGKRGPRKTALPCSFPQPPVMTVTNSMEAGDAKGFTVSSFSCDRQPAYSATGFTSSAKEPVCQDTCLHLLSQLVTEKIPPLSTAIVPGKQVVVISPDGALASARARCPARITWRWAATWRRASGPQSICRTRATIC